MKQTVKLLTVLAGILVASCAVMAEKAVPTNAAGRERLSMDFEWRFSLGHANDMVKDFDYMGGDPYGNAKTGDLAGPPHPNFDDSVWEVVDVPHDWGVSVGFDKDAEPSHGYRKLGRRYPKNSIGWYRKTFEIPATDLGKRLTIEFDGVFRDCQVWLNGHPLWHQQSGYTSFGFDITDYAKYGDKNTLVVRADASGYELWSYEGAGIYRHVWLVKTNPLHVARWGTYVSSDVKLKSGKASAELTIKTTLENEQDENTECELISTIIDPDGRKVKMAKSKKSIGAWESKQIVQKTEVERAKLWSLDSPNLYRMLTTIKQGGKIIDTYETTFGIRTFKFDADKGFYLNGKPMKLKGVCLHQDHGGVGIAIPDRLHEFRINKLKEMGCNSIRLAHNWVASEMLDACDRLGILIMDETRMSGSSDELLEQLETMVRRDRNHPSIIIWSLGNEEHIIQGSEVGRRIFRTMKRVVQKLDPTRPVTLGMNGDWGSVVTEDMDIQGCNYLLCGNITELRQKFPNKPIILSESGSTLTTRGVYDTSAETGHCADYDEVLPEWGHTAESMWKFVAERDWLAGTYVWTGFDYGGEPLPHSWPTVNSNFGIIDRAGFPKDNFYYYQSWWTDKTVLHLSPHWNWPGQEGAKKRVWCNTNCQEVELIINGKSLGRKAVPRNSRARWNVEFQPGFIEARGYNNGKLVAKHRRQTTGKVAAIRLKPDRTKIKAGNQDVSLVTVEVVDDKGRIVPTANNEITLTICNNGRIIGVCNGDPSCHVLENQTTYPVFNGLMMVFVQSGWNTGPITLKAEAKGLEKAQVSIEAEACTPRPFVSSVKTKASHPSRAPLLQQGNFVHVRTPNPVIKQGKAGTWDDAVLESADCFKDGDTYYWYFHAYNKSGPKARYELGVATAKSPLGPWTKYRGNPILKISKGKWEEQLVACAMITKEADTYYMFYTGAGKDWRCRIGLATAPHPLGPWTKYSNKPIIDHEKFGFVGGVVKVRDKYYLYSVPPDEVQPDYGRMYLATADTPEGPWEIKQEPVLIEGPKGSWDEGGFSEFEVLYYNDMFHAFYGGSLLTDDRDTARESIGYAYSTDGINWTKYADNPVIPTANVPNAAAFAEVHAILEYPRIYCYHTLRYLKCPDGEDQKWFDEDWIEHLGTQVLEITSAAP